MNSQRKFLDKLAEKYNKKEYLKSDPILFCYRYKKIEDIEIIGFISALFSYGNVLSIQKHLQILFSLLGNSPFAFIKNGKFSLIKNEIPKYRFQTSADNYLFLQTLSSILEENSSLEKLFLGETASSLNERIVKFQNHFTAKAKDISNQSSLSYGIRFLVGSGKINASHKRYNMFLRWMVRRNFPDFGIYKSISPSKLNYPTDVHIVRLANILGLSSRKTVDAILAKEISDQFRKINPNDPLSYDFALSRLGILRICKVKYVREICETCELRKICCIYNSREKNESYIF